MIDNYNNEWNAPVRRIKGKVELFTSSTALISGEGSVTIDKAVFCPKCTPKGWIESKNLIPYPYTDSNGTYNGITYTVNNDGSIKLVGTATTDYKFYLAKDLPLKAGTYTLANNTDYIVGYLVKKADGTFINIDETCNFTIDAEATIDIYIDMYEGYFANSTYYPMLIRGTETDTAYSKYVSDLPVGVMLNDNTPLTLNEDGTINFYGVMSLQNSTLSVDAEGVVINVEYNALEYTDTFTREDRIKSFTIERIGDESKFFGFGVCQKLNLKLINKDNALNITTGNAFQCYLSSGDEYITPTPTFFVTEVWKDEKTNELSITAYDLLYWSSEHYSSELMLPDSYMLVQVINPIPFILGSNSINLIDIDEDFFIKVLTLEYENGANLEGTESIRELLNAFAEIIQSIYYVDANNTIVFKAMLVDSDAVYTINKDAYIELDSKTNRRLTGIVSATELGDNIGVSLDESGTTQYLRNNPFLELRDDKNVLVQDFLNNIGGLTINQFSCKWRGNYALEVGDKIALVTKDNEVMYSYIFNDVIEYNGGLIQHTSWNYIEGEESESNPATLGEALRQTYAKVDKVNKEVEIVAAETTALKMNAENVNITITTINENLNSKVSNEDVNAVVKSEIVNGVNKVVTSTGFTFDDEGLKVSKSDSEITTLITDDGMQIYKNDKRMLTADNQGVKAEDLHATTYLIIGKNSRFEDYGNGRTACIWIG